MKKFAEDRELAKQEDEQSESPSDSGGEAVVVMSKGTKVT
jgi:hypothetical protein